MSGEKNSKYKKDYDQLGYNYCLLGAKDTELAEFFSVSEQTINAWKKAHPTFLESIKRGKSVADGNVANSLYNRAVGYSHPEQKVFNNQGEILTHDTTKHYAPDPTSAIFWLKNRQPKLWRDKQEIDNNIKVSAAEDWDDI